MAAPTPAEAAVGEQRAAYPNWRGQPTARRVWLPQERRAAGPLWGQV